MFITPSPVELRRVRYLQFVKIVAETKADDAREPRAARNVAPGECWAFIDHRTVAEIIAEGLL
jgi:hypothetical protein